MQEFAIREELIDPPIFYNGALLGTARLFTFKSSGGGQNERPIFRVITALNWTKLHRVIALDLTAKLAKMGRINQGLLCKQGTTQYPTHFV